MSAITMNRSKNLRWIHLASGILILLFTAAVVAVSSLSIYFLGSRLWYYESIFPGVRVGNVELGGMNTAEAVQELQASLTYPDTGRIVMSHGEITWTATPAQLGGLIDYQAIAEEALSIGRRGNIPQRMEEQIDTWYFGHPISPQVIFDQLVTARYLDDIAQEIEQPTLEAALRIEGVEVKASPGQIGLALDLPAILLALGDPISAMRDAEVVLAVQELPPAVLDASAAAEIARESLSEPLQIRADGFDGLTIQPAQLAPMLGFELDGEDSSPHYSIAVDPDLLAAYLDPVAPDLVRSPANARFIFNDDTRQLDLLAPAVIGRTLNLEQSAAAMNVSLNSGAHTAELAFDLQEPEITDDTTAEDLGISEEVSVVSSYFNGSSAARIQNIKTASSAFHGLLIPPGGTLSMADVLGDISLDSGYAEALIIFGDKTINGVGGGVCQVSTTLFRTVFFGGYEILERHPHAYRVGYYEQGPGSPGPGLDATVFVPMVDFKFRNDSPYWLLSETYMYGTQLLWKFYSTSDGRSVEWSSHVSNEKDAPKPLYKENDDLDKGEVKQIDYEADGMDVVVYRTVSRSGEIVHQDTIKTHYLPWRAIYEFGPGTKLPDDVKVEKD
jgi:vancomycin resistance protein YoaR